jgi:CubicO group peptidase (beta-lactamase class C family)
MANYEHDIPNTPQTKFRLGSITKQFTAMAIMQLQAQDLLSVNDTLSKYIPDYPNGDKITIHHLLTHTSGIANFTELPESERKKIKPHTLEQLIERFKHKPVDFKPGEKHSYSNSGYMLLTYIIEKASGKKYEIVLKENIFAPLNMNNTGYDKSRIIIKNRASGYSKRDRTSGCSNVDGELVNADYTDMSYHSGAGALYSTVEDLYLWDQALYSEKLLSNESLSTIFIPHIIISTDSPDSLSYGYGWRVGKMHGRNITEHTGGIEGFSTIIRRYLDDKLCIIILSNCDYSSIGKICQGLEAIVFGEKYELPKKRVAVAMDSTIYDQYVGQYKLKEDSILTVTKEDNKLFTQVTGQEKFEIYPEAETEFFVKSFDAKISFVKGENGKATKLILHQGGMDHVAEKIE